MNSSRLRWPAIFGTAGFYFVQRGRGASSDIYSSNSSLVSPSHSVLVSNYPDWKQSFAALFYISHNDPVPTKKTSHSPHDCENPVCRSTNDMFQKALKGHYGTKIGSDTVTNDQRSETIGSTNAENVKPVVSLSSLSHCPLDINAIGNSSWDIIHTIAAYYPESPSDEQMSAATSFFNSLALLYPCSICAPDFLEFVQNHPPRVSSRGELVLWCCELHNSVNIKLGKPPVECTVSEMDVYWKMGTAGCHSISSHLLNELH